MRRSSKALLVLSFFLAAGLVSFYVPLLRESQPDFSEKDSHEMLDRLAEALNDKSVDRVLAFAAPDAVIVGRSNKQLRDDLRRGFASARYLDVAFSDRRYARQGDTVTLGVHVIAGEKPPGSAQVGEMYYDDRLQFTLRRREIRHMGGLFSTFEWRVTQVTGANLPSGAEGF
jgi:hypothetical protein